MTIEVQLNFIAAGTYGSTKELNKSRVWLVPSHGVRLNSELFDSHVFNGIFSQCPGGYVIRPDPEKPAVGVIPLTSISGFIDLLCKFLNDNQLDFKMDFMTANECFKNIIGAERLTESEATIYLEKLSVSHPMDYKKFKANEESSADLAIETANIEKQQGDPCLIWLIKAYRYNPQHDFFTTTIKLNNFISSVPITEFKTLFSESGLPFWLMRLKANTEKELEQPFALTKPDAFSEVLYTSHGEASWAERVNGLKQAFELQPQHVIFSTPEFLSDHLAGMDATTLNSLFCEGEKSYWLLNALSVSSSKIRITLGSQVLLDALAQQSMYYFLSQTRSLVELKIAKEALLGIDVNDIINVVTNALSIIRLIDTLDISNVAIGDDGLENILQKLQNVPLWKCKVLDIRNCNLSKAALHLLEAFIKRCDILQEIRIENNPLLEGKQQIIAELIHRNSPVIFMRDLLSNDTKFLGPKSKEINAIEDPMQLEDISDQMVDGGSDNFILDKNNNLICHAVDKALEKLNASITLFQSIKYQPLNTLKTTFQARPSEHSFNALLVELTDSKRFEKKGMTGSFKIFTGDICGDINNRERLLMCVSKLLNLINEENNRDVSKAIIYVEALLKMIEDCTNEQRLTR